MQPKPLANSISGALKILLQGSLRVHIIPLAKRNLISVILFSLLVSTALCFNQQFTFAAEDLSRTYVHITPVISIAEQESELFEIAVNITDVNNLQAVDFELQFNASLLEAVQIVQGSFLPHPPQSIVETEVNNLAGWIHVNIAAIDSEPGQSGNGTLAMIVFKVIWGAAGSYSALHLQDSLLYNDAMTLIAHDSYSGLYFWGGVQFDPPIEGRELDLYTQKDGIGSDEYGGLFLEDEIVYLHSRVTYNNMPVQQKIVAFQVISPASSSFVLASTTDQNGVATTEFRLPEVLEYVGEWTVISTVDVSGITVWDTMRFLVERPIVGGFSESVITPHLSRTPIYYAATVSVVALAFAVITRKIKKESST